MWFLVIPKWYDYFSNMYFEFLFLQKRDYVRLSPVNSLGSSANSSPGNGADPSHDPHSFSNNYRSLAYLPGSVHGASQLQNPQQQQQHNNNNTALPSITTLGNAGKEIECRFEPGSAKDQLISKADWCAIDSPKKRTEEFVLFAFFLFTANKSNSSVRFLGESMARQSAFRN